MNYMCKAMQFARKAQYTAAPNPMVGCVIENNGKIVGHGWHKGPGYPHAEIEALKVAGNLAKGANLYVNLEPCCHYGRTPPCVDAIIQSKLKSVHIATTDPNPLINGKGIEKLKAAGINIFLGEEKQAAEKLNEVFFHYITTKQPYVIAKWAMTLDGKIATKTGNSKWITNVQARTHSHGIRSKNNAILTGVNTIINDDSQLTVRYFKNKNIRQPLRIVLDSKGRTPKNATILQTSSGKTLLATTNASKISWRSELESMGADVAIFPQDKNGLVDIPRLLKKLGKDEISSLLVEGGATVLTSFLRQNLINKFLIYVAPKLIGGELSFSPLLDLNINKMSEAINLAYEEIIKIGGDIFIAAKPIWNT